MDKKKLIGVVVSLFIFQLFVNAEEDSPAVYIKASGFASPLVEQWIAAYQDQYPDASIRLAGKDRKEEAVELVIRSYDPEEIPSGKEVVYTGRYALLPATTKDNPYLNDLTGRKWSKKEVRKLFFSGDPLEEVKSKKEKVEDKLTVYAGNRSATSVVVASHFGSIPSDLKGARISGDDRFLLNALQKDPTGIMYNALPYLFDLETRRLKPELVLLPLDVKKEHQVLFSQPDIDRTIEWLEARTAEAVPVGYIGFIYTAGQDDRLDHFLQWVTQDGQSFCHRFGLLQLDPQTLAQQQKKLSANRQFLTKQ